MNSVLHWLAMPLSGASVHAIEPETFWHARLMVLAWGILLPLGALMARYFKVLPSQNWPAVLDNKWWWHGHLALQWSGMALASVGVYLLFNHAQHSPLALFHSTAGWVLMLLAWMQIMGGLLRGSKGGPTAEKLRGDHYDMTPHRARFERVHKLVGWACVLGAVAVLLTGLLLADAPRWMPLVLGLWWLGLLGLAWRWQTQGRCIDTYQAIWGPDPRHPGNHIPPIGWGIRRPTPSQNHGQS
jgi:hypothetical protein